MFLLVRARLLIAFVPFHRWRPRLGLSMSRAACLRGPDPASTAHRLARQVERAAVRLPFAVKCLPRAMALSALLQGVGIAHTVVFLIRPPGHLGDGDRLHAWVERDGLRLIGDLPGPWVELHRIDGTG